MSASTGANTTLIVSLNEAVVSDPADDAAKMRPDDDENGQDEE